MAEFDPDAFVKKYGDQEPEESKFATKGSAIGRGVTKFIAGVPRGLATAAANITPYLPTSPGGFASASLPTTREAVKSAQQYGAGGDTEGPEAAGKFVGEMAPSFMVPELGLAGAGARAGMRIIPKSLGPGLWKTGALGGATAEGAISGGIGGLTQGGDTGDAGTGAEVGGAVRGFGQATSMVPGRYKWLLNIVPAGIAVKILHGMGLPEWLALPALGLGHFGHRFGLGGTGLGELAGRAAQRAPPGAVGAAAAHVRSAEDDDDGR